jgi:ribonucleoside-diphosphate reductase beta chain
MQNTIFDDQIARKPNQYPWSKDFIQTMWNNPWNVDEFNFSSDYQDFKVRLSDSERELALRTLSAIAQIEVSVKTFWGKLGDNLPPMRDLGYVMANVETVHNFAYEKLLTALEMESIFEENLKNPLIIGRVNYLRKYNHRFYSDSKKQYVYALALFTIFVENVSLFSQFYIMNWLNRNKNVLKNVNQQILYTKNEETIHFLVGVKLINTIKEEFPDLFDDELKNLIINQSKDSIEHELKIIEWILQDYNKEDLNKEVLGDFIKYRMNDSLTKIGLEPIFEISQDNKKKFWWFEEEVYANNMVDFFNQRSVDYSKNSKSFDEEDLF